MEQWIHPYYELLEPALRFFTELTFWRFVRIIAIVTVAAVFCKFVHLQYLLLRAAAKPWMELSETQKNLVRRFPPRGWTGAEWHKFLDKLYPMCRPYTTAQIYHRNGSPRGWADLNAAERKRVRAAPPTGWSVKQWNDFLDDRACRKRKVPVDPYVLAIAYFPDGQLRNSSPFADGS